MKAVAFHPEAEAEFIAAAQHYERQAPGLGLDFISAVERTYQRLAAFPESGHEFGARLRRVLVPGFPYGLLYRAEPGLPCKISRPSLQSKSPSRSNALRSIPNAGVGSLSPQFLMRQPVLYPFQSQELPSYSRR